MGAILSRRKINFGAALFGGIALLFNPIFPVYLQDKELWTTIDILSAIAFVWAGIYVNKKLKEDGNEHSKLR